MSRARTSHLNQDLVENDGSQNEVGQSYRRAGQPTALAGGRRLAKVVRFDATERAVHWLTAGLMLWLIATGAILYVPALSVAIGHRSAVEQWHVVAGIALPLPVLIGWLLPGGRGLRADLRRLNRWWPEERRWWRRRTRPSLELDKFNPGQKLNTAFVGGSIVVMLMTGLVMRFSAPFPISFATGATFVHDWLALAIVVATLGHVAKALSEPFALTGMVTGRMPRYWVRHHFPAWYRTIEAGSDDRDPDQARPEV